MTIESPRFDFVYNKACEFLLSLCVSCLPVNPQELISRKRWGLVTYSELCSLVPDGATIEDIAEACQSRDGFTVYSGGNYCIAYNDAIRVKSRIAFTLMHEAGHIVCGHFSGHAPTLSGGEYRVFETEANYFASNVLAPAAVAAACDLRTPELLQAACGLSYDAAKARLNELNNWKSRPVDDKIWHAFDPYIRISSRRCSPKQADIGYDEAGVF
jgi:hypothetical protein